MLKTGSRSGVWVLALLSGLGASLGCGGSQPAGRVGSGGMVVPASTGGRSGGGPGGSSVPMNGSGGSMGAGGAAAPAGAAELQYSGSISVERAALSAGTGEVEHLEISAPILPRVLVLYQGEGARFPGDAEGQAKLAHDSSLTFDVLLKECPAKYPEIVTPGPGDPPTTPEQNASNLEAIATCAYEQYTAKPYWIPALIDKVDICAAELGTDWHLPTEKEIEGLGDSSGAEIAKALATPNSGRYFGNFYFGLSVWTRGTNGTLRIGDLSPAASQRVVDAPVPATSTVHYEGGVALRCIRRVDGGGSGGVTGTGVGGGGSGPAAGGAGGAGGLGFGGNGGGGGGGAGGNAPVNCDGFRIPEDHPTHISYDTSVTDLVTDAVTGLMWERTPTASEVSPYVSSTFCPARNTGGLAGWRLPTLLELESIADLAARGPAIDAVAFPQTPSSFFASSTQIYMHGQRFVGDGYVWTSDFDTGSTVNGLPPSYFIRCVRRPAPGLCFSTDHRFRPDSISSTAAVIDDMTGLSWQRDVAPAPLTWDQARAYCAARGAGFRLPGVKELLSIVDFKATPVPIDASAFPSTPNQEYWTATTVAGNDTDAWTNSFQASDHAFTATAGTSEERYVRCVR